MKAMNSVIFFAFELLESLELLEQGFIRHAKITTESVAGLVPG